MRQWAAVTALFVAACAHVPSAQHVELIAVTRDAGKPKLHKIDLATRAVLGTVPIGVNGHELAVSRDGRFAYVPIYGDSAVGQPGSDGSSIDVIDLATMQRVSPIDLGEKVRPHAVAVDQDGLLWVTAELVNSIFVVEPKRGEIIARVKLGQPQAHMLELSPDGRRAYTANISAGTVSVIDVKERRLLATVPVAKRIQRITVSSDNRYVFTQDTDTPRVGVIDAATNKLVRWVDIPLEGYASAATPDGRHLLVASPTRQRDAEGLTLSRAFAIDLGTWKVAHEIAPGCAPVNIVMSKKHNRAFLGCPEGKVAVVDLATMRLEPSIEISRGLDGIALR